MNMYEIDVAITSLVDQETGEILDYESFAALAMEREQKLENMALWYKDLKGDAAKIRAEELQLAARRQECERRAEKLKEYLCELLAGEKFKTHRVACSFRTSTALKIEDEAAFIKAMEESQHYEYLRFGKPEVNRTAITDAIKAGAVVEGAELVKKQNVTIK